jgi:hypothetical protein
VAEPLSQTWTRSRCNRQPHVRCGSAHKKTEGQKPLCYKKSHRDYIKLPISRIWTLDYLCNPPCKASRRCGPPLKRPDARYCNRC